MIGVEDVQNGVGVKLLTCSVYANLEKGECTFKQLFKVWALENPDPYLTTFVLERSVEVWLRIWPINLIYLNIYSCRSMYHCLIHVEQEEPLARLKLYVDWLSLWQLLIVDLLEVNLLQVSHVNEILDVL